MKIAFVYDRVNTPYGGAENVLLALHELFPKAPLYTAVFDAQRAQWARDFTVIPSFLQKILLAKKFHRVFAMCMPLAFELFDLSTYDIVISITSAEAKGVLTKPHQLHICYLLTPTRYLWSHAEEYEDHWLTGGFRKMVFKYLKWWDEAACLRPDVYVPISTLVAQRCRRYYLREPLPVIYPPGVDESFQKHLCQISQKRPPFAPQDYYLIVSRLVPYKRIDLAILACQQLGKNLVIIGQGPDAERLTSLIEENDAHPNAKILLLQAVQATEVIAYYQHCRAFLAPAEEDFGITVLEAQAAGKPVIVYHKSGGAEVIVEGKTGVTFPEQTVKSLTQAIAVVESKAWDEKEIQKQAARYQKKEFQEKFRQMVENEWKKFERKT